MQLDNLPGDRHSNAMDANAGILTELSGLSSGKHILSITLEDGNGQLDFNRVVFDAGVRRCAQVRHVTTFIHKLTLRVDENSNCTKITMNMRLDSPGWSFMSWAALKHFYHNIDGSETDRSQEGVVAKSAGAKAEFTFSGMSYGPEYAYRNAVNLIASRNATNHCRRKRNLPHR